MQERPQSSLLHRILSILPVPCDSIYLERKSVCVAFAEFLESHRVACFGCGNQQVIAYVAPVICDMRTHAQRNNRTHECNPFIYKGDDDGTSESAKADKAAVTESSRNPLVELHSKPSVHSSQKDLASRRRNPVSTISFSVAGYFLKGDRVNTIVYSGRGPLIIWSVTGTTLFEQSK
jgi:hypothetical protein